MGEVIYKSIGPIGDTDPANMSVRDVGRAAAWYKEHMGFDVVSHDETSRSIRLKRDSIEFGLAENGGDSEQQSCYFEVSDVDLAREELLGSNTKPGEIRTDTYGGNSYRVFFIKDEDGLCYCIGQKQTV